MTPARHPNAPATPTAAGRPALLPAPVAALVRSRRVLVADLATSTDDVTGTWVEIGTSPTNQELTAAGLTPQTQPSRTAIDVAVRFLLSFPVDTTRCSYSSTYAGSTPGAARSASPTSWP